MREKPYKILRNPNPCHFVDLQKPYRERKAERERERERERKEMIWLEEGGGFSWKLEFKEP
jgi:hypothetical protein